MSKIRHFRCGMVSTPEAPGLIYAFISPRRSESAETLTEPVQAFPVPRASAAVRLGAFWVPAGAFLHSDELDLEGQCGVGRDGSVLFGTVSLIPGNVDDPFGAHLHIGECSREAGDDTAHGELNGLAVRRIEGLAA